MIPYGRQDISEEDVSAVVEALRSDFLTQGPATFRFEKLISKLTKCKYVVSTNSASSALHVACLALDLKKNDDFLELIDAFDTRQENPGLEHLNVTGVYDSLVTKLFGNMEWHIGPRGNKVSNFKENETQDRL